MLSVVVISVITLTVIILLVIMLNVIMLSVIMQNAVAPLKHFAKKEKKGNIKVLKVRNMVPRHLAK